MSELKTTKIGESYWNESGAYQKDYNALFQDMVPEVGRADTVNAELIRSISRLIYEYGSNGNMNAKEVEAEYFDEDCWACLDDETSEHCFSCDGTGTITEEVESDPEIAHEFNEFIEFIRKNVNKENNELEQANIDKEIDDLKQVILNGDGAYREQEMNKYDIVCDRVVQHVLISLSYNPQMS